MFSYFDLENKDIYKIIDLLNASIYWKDTKGNYLGCNKYMLDLFNLKDRANIIGKNDSTILNKNEANIIAKVDQSVIKGTPYNNEEVVTMANGEFRTYISNKTPILDTNNKVVGLLGISTDITNLKNKMELEKQQVILNEEQKIRQIIDVVDASIYWKDSNGKYLGCNKYVLDILGFTNWKKPIGKTDYEFLPNEEANKIKAIDKSVIKNGSYRGEESGTLPNSKKKIFLLTVKNQLLDDKGNVIGIVGTSLDITAQKEAENLRLEAHKKFKKTVNQVVHDIKSPLASLISIVEDSASNIPEARRITLRQAAMRISDIAQHMLNKYKDKIDNNELPQPVLVSGALLEVLGEKRYEYPSINLEHKFINAEASFTFIRIEPSHFKRMISNLLNNAAQALDNKPDSKVIVKLDIISNEFVFIFIEDNGRGMSEELIDKIENNISFTSGKKHGSGIGLTQVYETLQRNYGKLQVSSTIGKQTIIMLRFPKILPPTWIAQEIKIIKGDTIVILDDDPSIHSLWDLKLASSLAKMPKSLKVEHFTDGVEAIDFINSLSSRERNKICLLTDYELLHQGINGLQVIEQTKIKRSTLVTSHYDDLEIREIASDLRIKILPKKLVFDVTINLDKKIKPGSKKVDMVIVDDNQSFTRGIIRQFFSNLIIDTYCEPDIFLEDVEQYPLNTKIILDRLYYDGPDAKAKFLGDGIELATKLNKKGFTNLFLLTAEEPNPSIIPPYLTVILKHENKKIKKLAN